MKECYYQKKLFEGKIIIWSFEALKGNSSDTSVHRLRTQSVATMLIRPVPPNQCKSYPYLKAKFTAAARQISVQKALKISLLSIVHQIPLK